MVILGWILDKPLALLFDPFESVVRALSALSVTANVFSTASLLQVLYISGTFHHAFQGVGRQVNNAS